MPPGGWMGTIKWSGAREGVLADSPPPGVQPSTKPLALKVLHPLPVGRVPLLVLLMGLVGLFQNSGTESWLGSRHLQGLLPFSADTRVWVRHQVCRNSSSVWRHLGSMLQSQAGVVSRRPLSWFWRGCPIMSHNACHPLAATHTRRKGPALQSHQTNASG